MILNDDFDRAYAELAHIYHAERLKSGRNLWIEPGARPDWTCTSRRRGPKEWIVVRVSPLECSFWALLGTRVGRDSSGRASR